MLLKKNSLLIVVMLAGIQSVWSQAGIYIAPSNNLFISSGTLFSTDSLVLLPSLNLTITGENSVTRNATVSHSTANPYIKRVFHFLNTAPSFSGNISIYYTDSELNGIAENALTLNVHNGTNWNAFTTSVTRDGVNNFVTTSGLSNLALNELTLAGLSAPLPVKFTFLNAVCANGNITLNWQTAQEVNSKTFEIQTSLDGINWQVVGTVPAAGNSSAPRNYSFTHTNSINNSFYRIAEYDLNGVFTFSTTLRSACSAAELFMVHPNPVQVKAVVTINVNIATVINLNLYDAKGALIKKVQKNLLRGVNQAELDMTGLSAGLYILTAQWGTTLKQMSIIKE